MASYAKQPAIDPSPKKRATPSEKIIKPVEPTFDFKTCAPGFYSGLEPIRTQYQLCSNPFEKAVFIHDLVTRMDAASLLYATSTLAEPFIWMALNDIFGANPLTVNEIVTSCVKTYETPLVYGDLGRFGYLTNKHDLKNSKPVFITNVDDDVIYYKKMNMDASLEVGDPHELDDEEEELVVADERTHTIYLYQLLEKGDKMDELAMPEFYMFAICQKIVSAHATLDPLYLYDHKS